ncbi:hypothetical protein [Secundilactobacillus collinoides]|uniref:Uncharacterized protein n=2 Tax=Secundilactobacillus collinoides TaxID=33960 RepID=A0A0R2BDT7_SECCO|nr:hypothetical protein [Secundilactobacillus collinoides]KRM74044.1 hypothetical protein FC82_GL000818 [Secundilactobacillus collinoides DSM 20515 = JCM 1123]KZL37725.1 hypothetical protein TY91_12355 [Secundilactobacillus collinoides]
MQKRKEAVQLDLALNDKQHEITATKLAKSIPVVKSSVTRWRNGKNKMDSSIMKTVAKEIHSVALHYSLARADYNILSFKESKRVSKDLFATTADQKKEEHDRQEVQDKAFESAAVPKEHRTGKDYECINNYVEQLMEEIGSEITELLTFCKYVGLDANELIKKFNEKCGG